MNPKIQSIKWSLAISAKKKEFETLEENIRGQNVSFYILSSWEGERKTGEEFYLFFA